MTRIKRSHLAGTWYVADAKSLQKQVDEFLAAARLHNGGAREPLAGLVVPHAGYAYSGRVAASGYAALESAAYSRAVILAPSHFALFSGIAVLDVDAFETPLGQVAVDPDGVAALAATPLVREDPRPFREEHSLEIQLPLLQRVLPTIRIVPALLGTLSAEEQAAVSSALRSLQTEQTVFIISSDFVHYGWRFGYLPFPAAGAQQVREQLRVLDMGAIEKVCAGDAAGFRRYVAETEATICGRMPIETFLTMHQARTPGRLMMYATSLDVTGDYEHCVSYASIAFPRASET